MFTYYSHKTSFSYKNSTYSFIYCNYQYFRASQRTSSSFGTKLALQKALNVTASKICFITTLKFSFTLVKSTELRLLKSFGIKTKSEAGYPVDSTMSIKMRTVFSFNCKCFYCLLVPFFHRIAGLC